MPKDPRRIPRNFFAWSSLLLTLLGCQETSFPAPFSLHNGGQTIQVSSRPVVPSSGLRFENSGASRWVFTWEAPIPLGPRTSFHLEYSVQETPDSLEIVFTSPDGRSLKTAPLPGLTGVRLGYDLTLPAGNLSGFTLQAKGAGAVTITASALGESDDRLVFDGTTLTQTEGVRWLSGNPEAGQLSFSLPGAEGFTLKLSASGQAVARFAGANAGERATRRLTLEPVGQTFSFTKGSLGFSPRRVDLSLTQGGSVSYEVRPLESPSRVDPLRPLPIDPGSLLTYDRAAWRRPDFELFSWGAFPHVLLFDFADYAGQAQFFRRLGFFVAVKGEAGQIEPEEYYRGRHVYNAHDYRPEDLARFFELARSSSVSLNEQETLLKEICLKNGLLVAQPDGSLVAGKGALASVSRESTPFGLRKELLMHELSHMLFYVVPGYRQRCLDLWPSLPEDEREFWTLFLGNKGRLDGRPGYDGYDTTNTYLLVNEMQAHLLQFDGSHIEPYFRAYVHVMETALPQSKALVRSFLDRPAFASFRARLAGYLQETAGLQDGDYFPVKSGP